jgi:hypothetical protein
MNEIPAIGKAGRMNDRALLRPEIDSTIKEKTTTGGRK